MATKSQIVSGMGMGLSFVQLLVGAVKKAGGTDEDIHRLTTANVNGVWDKIASLVIEAGKKVKEVFTIVVDYSRSVKDSISAGKYDYANEGITKNNFPSAEHEKGKKELQFTLYHFGRDVESDYAISEMDKDGKRPATLRELLAFGETNPEFQNQFPIIALGSFWVNRNGYRYVACLFGFDSERYLCLDWYDYRWDDDYRFLAVSK
jgi:hypothetical protein